MTLSSILAKVTGRSSLNSSTIYDWPPLGGRIAIGIMRNLPLSTMKAWQITNMKGLLVEVDRLEKQAETVTANQLRSIMDSMRRP